MEMGAAMSDAAHISDGDVTGMSVADLTRLRDEIDTALMARGVMLVPAHGTAFDRWLKNMDDTGLLRALQEAAATAAARGLAVKAIGAAASGVCREGTAHVTLPHLIEAAIWAGANLAISGEPITISHRAIARSLTKCLSQHIGFAAAEEAPVCAREMDLAITRERCEVLMEEAEKRTGLCLDDPAFWVRFRSN